MGNCGSASSATTHWQRRQWQQQREQQRHLQQHVQQHTRECWQTDVRADVLDADIAAVARPSTTHANHDHDHNHVVPLPSYDPK